MEASPPLFYSRDMEYWLEGGFLPSHLYQPYQQQQQTDSFYSPLPPMPVAPPSYSPVNLPLSMDQSLTNLRFQNNRPRAALHQQHMEPMATYLLSQEACDLIKARERILELEARLRRAEEERETWQRIAREHDATIASLNRTLEQLREPSTGSSPDAGDAATCSSRPLATEEPRRGTGVELCKACGSPNSHLVLLSCSNLCEFQLREASLDG